MRVYLAGPMSGIKSFNFPAFHTATKYLRAQGFDVVSPAEEDWKCGIGEQAEASETGNPTDIKETWGSVLARDVKLIADGGIKGIIFLPDWDQSRGARLEATVGLLQPDFSFFQYRNGHISMLSRREVAWRIFDAAQ